MLENTDQKKLRIWTLFTQCYSYRSKSGYRYRNTETTDFDLALKEHLVEILFNLSVYLKTKKPKHH